MRETLPLAFARPLPLCQRLTPCGAAAVVPQGGGPGPPERPVQPRDLLREGQTARRAVLVLQPCLSCSKTLPFLAGPAVRRAGEFRSGRMSGATHPPTPADANANDRRPTRLNATPAPWRVSSFHRTVSFKSLPRPLLAGRGTNAGGKLCTGECAVPRPHSFRCLLLWRRRLRRDSLLTFFAAFRL